MAKRVAANSLGIHKKKKFKKHPTSRKKRFLTEVVHYLRSDCYMYAPFAYDDFSPTTSGSLPPPPTGVVEAERPSEGKKKKLIEKVGEYLKSDCFMYAPLTDHYTQTTPSPPQGPTWLDKRPTTSVSDRELTKGIDQRARETVHATGEAQINNNRPYRRSTRFQQTRENHETLNYIVQQNWRPSPGGGILGRERRNLVVE